MLGRAKALLVLVALLVLALGGGAFEAFEQGRPRSITKTVWRSYGAKGRPETIYGVSQTLKRTFVARADKVHNKSCDSGPSVDFAKRPSSEELSILRYAADKAQELMWHLSRRPRRTAEDIELTPIVRTNFNGNVFLTLMTTGGAYNKCAGLQLRYADEYTRIQETSAPRIHTKLLHEIAHAVDGSHGEGFARANRWLVNIATKELGWRVALSCAACHRSGVCRNDCPKCEWWEDPATCKRYVPSD